jgi:hypothetical protein
VECVFLILSSHAPTHIHIFDSFIHSFIHYSLAGEGAIHTSHQAINAEGRCGGHSSQHLNGLAVTWFGLFSCMVRRAFDHGCCSCMCGWVGGWVCSFWVVFDFMWFCTLFFFSDWMAAEGWWSARVLSYKGLFTGRGSASTAQPAGSSELTGGYQGNTTSVPVVYLSVCPSVRLSV